MKYDIKLPPEFISTNSTPVSVATIKRERMEEILREAAEADRREILTLCQRVQELESQLPKWISVEDKLPEGKQRILLLDDYGGKYSGRGAVLIATNNSYEPTTGLRTRYTHWMPFPQPPIESGEEE